jgi:hypothetical protein
MGAFLETTANTPVLTVTVTDRGSRDMELDAAVTAVREQAFLEGRRGILVTRHAPGTFIVELSDEVPYGVTLERDTTAGTATT